MYEYPGLQHELRIIMDYAKMVPTQEDLEFLENTLMQQDIVGELEDCKAYDDGQGNCQMCTAMQRLHFLIELMKNEDAWIGTK